MNVAPFMIAADPALHDAAGPPVARACGWREWSAAQAVALWEGLAASASTPNPFFEPWYLLPALEAFDPGERVRLLTVHIGDELIGLMPLGTDRRYGRWPLRHMAGWLHANAFLGAPLVRAGCEAPFWQAALEWADANAGAERALFLHLAAMPLEQPLTQALFDVAGIENRTAALVMREQRALLHSPLSPELYLERALPGKKRKELRRQFARLAEQGELSFARECGESGIERWIADFMELEQRGWKGANGSAMGSAPETAALFREALIGAAQAGKLERLSLVLDSRPIAMLVSFLTPPGSFSYKTAFDEAFARFSPGVLLQRENLAMLGRPEIGWCDSCAAPDHPMIDSLWTERRPIGRISVGIGGKVRRTLFDRLLALELGRNPTGIDR